MLGLKAWVCMILRSGHGCHGGDCNRIGSRLRISLMIAIAAQMGPRSDWGRTAKRGVYWNPRRTGRAKEFWPLGRLFESAIGPKVRLREQNSVTVYTSVWVSKMRTAELLRPNPERLLKQVQAEESKRLGAKLKIFLGYAPGVGKSYRMLDEARRRHERGEDVVVGAVQDEQSSDIRALLQTLEQIPLIETAEGRAADVGAILRRAPKVCVIDPLAALNPPGSRNAHRWQDVQPSKFSPSIPFTNPPPTPAAPSMKPSCTSLPSPSSTTA